MGFGSLLRNFAEEAATAELSGLACISLVSDIRSFLQ